jgi:hypothetical protein
MSFTLFMLPRYYERGVNFIAMISTKTYTHMHTDSSIINIFKISSFHSQMMLVLNFSSDLYHIYLVYFI